MFVWGKRKSVNAAHVYFFLKRIYPFGEQNWRKIIAQWWPTTIYCFNISLIFSKHTPSLSKSGNSFPIIRTLYGTSFGVQVHPKGLSGLNLQEGCYWCCFVTHCIFQQILFNWSWTVEKTSQSTNHCCKFLCVAFATPLPSKRRRRILCSQYADDMTTSTFSNWTILSSLLPSLSFSIYRSYWVFSRWRRCKK